MNLTVQPSGASCGATITGVHLNQPLSSDLVAEIRAHWLEHKVVSFRPATHGRAAGGLQ